MNRRDLIKNSGFVLGSAVLSRPRALASVNDTRMTLLEPGRSAQVVVREQDLGSAEYFAAIFLELTGQKLTIVTRYPPESNQPLILIGDVLTNPKIRELAGEQRCRKLTAQGILVATVSDGRRPILLVAGGSHAATPGA